MPGGNIWQCFMESFSFVRNILVKNVGNLVYLGPLLTSFRPFCTHCFSFIFSNCGTDPTSKRTGFFPTRGTGGKRKEKGASIAFFKSQFTSSHSADPPVNWGISQPVPTVNWYPSQMIPRVNWPPGQLVPPFNWSPKSSGP